MAEQQNQEGFYVPPSDSDDYDDDYDDDAFLLTPPNVAVTSTEDINLVHEEGDLTTLTPVMPSTSACIATDRLHSSTPQRKSRMTPRRLLKPHVEPTINPPPHPPSTPDSQPDQVVGNDPNEMILNVSDDHNTIDRDSPPASPSPPSSPIPLPLPLEQGAANVTMSDDNNNDVDGNDSNDLSEDDNTIDRDNLEDPDDDLGIPLQRLVSRPMVNFARDLEDFDDFAMGWGWEWHDEDPGASIRAFDGVRQCLLDPTKTKPEDFFMALFERPMYTIIAENTNIYARERLQQLGGKFSQNSVISLFWNIHTH